MLKLDVLAEKSECQRLKITMITKEEQYKAETETFSDTIEDLRKQLNAERENKSKLIAVGFN